MKTNQTLSVGFDLGNLIVKHKNQMVELESFVILVNRYRMNEGLHPIASSGILKRESVKEYIHKIGRDENIKMARGKGKSYVSLKLAIRIAIELSPEFADDVIETFINKRLTHLRDLGGDKYIELNDALTMYAETVLGKPAHKGHFINISKIIKQRLDVEDWNEAKPWQHAERARIEQALTTMLKVGVVKDWDHLKELAKEV